MISGREMTRRAETQMAWVETEGVTEQGLAQRGGPCGMGLEARGGGAGESENGARSHRALNLQ